MTKYVLSILSFILLNACATKQQTTALVSTQVQSQPVAPSPASISTKEATDEQKQEVENITWKLPNWCEDLEQNFNQIQVCGVALHKNLQMSRARSEMDARKQLARRAAGQVDETITETITGSSSEVTSIAILTSKSEVERYIIENQKTIQSEGKYLTFTKVVQYFK